MPGVVGLMGFLCLPDGEKVGTSIRSIIFVVPGRKPTDDEPPSRYASPEGPKLLPAPKDKPIMRRDAWGNWVEVE
jgi:hypothetical protein